MATRHQVRRSVISLLYASEISGENKDFVEEFLLEKKIKNEQKNFALELYNGVSLNLSKLDKLISENLKDFDRLSKIELMILRLSVYELCFSKIQKAVVINEAVELGKELGNDNSSKLINAVLDTLAKKDSK